MTLWFGYSLPHKIFVQFINTSMLFNVQSCLTKSIYRPVLAEFRLRYFHYMMIQFLSLVIPVEIHNLVFKWYKIYRKHIKLDEASTHPKWGSEIWLRRSIWNRKSRQMGALLLISVQPLGASPQHPREFAFRGDLDLTRIFNFEEPTSQSWVTNETCHPSKIQLLKTFFLIT